VVGVLVAIAFIYPRHPTIRWWHSQHDTSSDRTPLSHMLPRVIGGRGAAGPGGSGIKRSTAKAGLRRLSSGGTASPWDIMGQSRDTTPRAQVRPRLNKNQMLHADSFPT
jgi:hypothetical protein